MSSVVVQPVPSRIAPYSPTKVLPVFGLIELVSECTPARRQNVVEPVCELTMRGIGWPGQMSTAPAGHVIVGLGPYDDDGGAVVLMWHCFAVPKIGSPNTPFVHGVPSDNVL